MKLMTAYAALMKLNAPAIKTADAAAALRINTVNASQILRRLMQAGFFVQLKRGLWAALPARHALEIADYLVAPYSCYVSLQTALYYHGVISQIPAVTYCVTLARTQRITTPIGTFSFHRIHPNFFFGYEAKNGVRMATMEKGLLDLLYLRQTLPRLFGHLPELELPKGFSLTRCRTMIEKISDPRRQRRISRELEQVIASAALASKE